MPNKIWIVHCTAYGGPEEFKAPTAKKAIELANKPDGSMSYHPYNSHGFSHDRVPHNQWKLVAREKHHAK